MPHPIPPKFAPSAETATLIGQLGEEFAIVRNPSYVFPPFEAYPLAPKAIRLDAGLIGIVKDMDGTTTTTEALCVHSLEMMIRRITNRLEESRWEGFDKQRDLPNIIGNSTTRHVEYLIQTYRAWIKGEAMKRAYIEAAAWTLEKGKDPGRRLDVESSIAALGLAELRRDDDFQALCRRLDDPNEKPALLDALTVRYSSAFKLDEEAQIVRAAIDIYYYRYHEILSLVSRGEGERLSREILGGEGRHLIEPLPGVLEFLALIRGWLEPEEAMALFDRLAGHLNSHGYEKERLEKQRGILGTLARHFQKEPLRVAVVTSSIAYEAHIVLGEVFRILSEEAAILPLTGDKRELLSERLKTPREYYDAMVTASDSSEIRLKPHRDLYSIALHRLGIGPEDFHKVAGFEDSESGTIAIRAAGVGCCIAVPIAETTGHNLHAACHVLTGGLPEAILVHGLFVE